MKLILQCSILSILPFVTLLMEEKLDGEFVNAVTSNGYPVESYTVETEDGYILTVFRIPHSKHSNLTNSKPILLGHGMFGSAEHYILLGEKSLAYVLADSGYDVWLMNARGAWHSRRHKTLNPDEKEFWQFSWHEIGFYDIPAIIDHILKITNCSGIYYLGQSQGCTTIFVMGSERPEYNNKINGVIAMASPVFFRNFKHRWVKLVVPYIAFLQNMANSLNIYEMPPPFFSAADSRELLRIICANDSILINTCTTIMTLISEANPATFDPRSLVESIPLTVSSISIKQILHYAQLISSGNFQQYDYGPKTNVVKYGTEYPPQYNLKNITFPVILIFGGKDPVATEEDQKILASKLQNLIEVYNAPSFSHFDFTLTYRINKSVLKMLKMLKNKQIKN